MSVRQMMLGRKPETGGALPTLSETWDVADNVNVSAGDLAWNSIIGDYNIVSLRAESQQVNSRNIMVADTDLGTSDMDVEVVVTRTSANGFGGGPIACSQRTTQAHYFAEVQHDAGELRLYRVASSSSATVVASKAYSIPQTCTVRLVVSGGDLEMFVDGVSELTYTDGSPLTGQYAGVRCYYGTGFPYAFDDFEVFA